MPLSLLHSPPDRAILTLAPGSRQRMREMAALRVEGFSLDEIAERYGVSRERVRQILRTHGGPDPQDVADARRRRAGRQAETHVDELLALWRCGKAPGIAAAALGLRAAACRGIIERFATDVDRAARQASLADARGSGAQTYSDQEILTALMSVATRVGRVPSAREYAALAGEQRLPSLATVLNRMGGWGNAIRAAGMLPLVAGAGARSRRWTDEACWTALRSVSRELGEIPSVRGYERHAEHRHDLPSPATIRNRLGRWSSIVTRLAAERELTALHEQYATQAP